MGGAASRPLLWFPQWEAAVTALRHSCGVHSSACAKDVPGQRGYVSAGSCWSWQGLCKQPPVTQLCPLLSDMGKRSCKDQLKPAFLPPCPSQTKCWAHPRFGPALGWCQAGAVHWYSLFLTRSKWSCERGKGRVLQKPETPSLSGQRICAEEASLRASAEDGHLHKPGKLLPKNVESNQRWCVTC